LNISKGGITAWGPFLASSTYSCTLCEKFRPIKPFLENLRAF
jgi:hypothetical protein